MTHTVLFHGEEMKLNEPERQKFKKANKETGKRNIQAIDLFSHPPCTKEVTPGRLDLIINTFLER